MTQMMAATAGHGTFKFKGLIETELNLSKPMMTCGWILSDCGAGESLVPKAYRKCCITTS
jgi:hypothetical protein